MRSILAYARRSLALCSLLCVACYAEDGRGFATMPGGMDPDTLSLLVLDVQLDTLSFGESRSYSVNVTQSADSMQPVTVVWTSTDPAVISIDAGTATAVGFGTASIIASYGTAADSATVVVSDEGVQLQLTPPTAAAKSGETIEFQARVVLPSGGSLALQREQWSDTTTGDVRSSGKIAVRQVGVSDTIAPFRVTYSATGGTITDDGRYTAGTTPGLFQVIVTQRGGHKADTSAVTILAPVATLLAVTITPQSPILAPGGSQQFAVNGAWSDKSAVVPAVTYTATGGTITSDGLYSAGDAPGMYRVIATHQGGTRADTSAVTISVAPPPLATLVLKPASLTMASGASQRFTVAGALSDGSSAVPAVRYTATGGQITSDGLYTAGTTPGAYRVIATHQGGTRADTSAVTISVPPPTLKALVLHPASVTLAPGAIQQFTVTASWSDGSSRIPAVTYSFTGGTATSGGLYTAGAKAGRFRVIVNQQGGTKADTSTVIVSAPAATALALLTEPGGASSGVPLSQHAVVELRDSRNQAVPQPGVVITASIASGSGTLSGQSDATTDSQGRAVFTGLEITGTGAHTVSFAAPFLLSATSATLTLETATLRSLATGRGFSIGAAVRDSAFRDDPRYRQTLGTQFNSLVPEDATDFWPIHPQPSQYNFGPADALVDFAEANGMIFRGHHLVWFSWIPTWVTSGGYTTDEVRNILKDHITTVVGRYRGRAASWDVVNEVIDNQACFSRCRLQPSFWLEQLGPEYIDSAFVWARRADPAAKLYLNDYRTETINNKSDAVLALAKSLRARGIPIDGVGFQVHILQQFFPAPTSAQVQANFQRFADAGFDIRITEMDVAISDAGGAAALANQAGVYSAILNACLNVARCVDFTTWGFSDRFNWVPSHFPGFGRALPFDSSYQPKPAFDALLTRLRQR